MGISPPGLISRPRPWGVTDHRVAVPASTLGLWLRDASGPPNPSRPDGVQPRLCFLRFIAKRPGSTASDLGRYLKFSLSCQGSGTSTIAGRTFHVLAFATQGHFCTIPPLLYNTPFCIASTFLRYFVFLVLQFREAYGTMSLQRST